MSWLEFGLGFVFLCNLVFLVGATFLLYRIVDSTELSRTELLKAAQQNADAGAQLLAATHRSVREMDRASGAQQARETSNHRAISELTAQVQSLVDSLKFVAATNGSGAPATHTPADALNHQTIELQALTSQHEKLQQQLTEALARNRQLQDDNSQTTYKLRDASNVNQELTAELRDLGEVKKTTVDRALKREAELEAALEQARERAKLAEKQVRDHAFKIEDLREQSGKTDAPAGEDLSALVQSQQAQIDLLATREKTFLARIESVEQTLQRNLAEKEFIEDRFLELDYYGNDVVEKPAPAGASVD